MLTLPGWKLKWDRSTKGTLVAFIGDDLLMLQRTTLRTWRATLRKKGRKPKGATFIERSKAADWLVSNCIKTTPPAHIFGRLPSGELAVTRAGA